jgi:serine/threonine protein kinase
MFCKRMVIHGEDFSMDGKLLGSGSQGEVFKIIHVKSGVVYAVKIVRLENTEAKKMMDHEITILKTISSPYIISILPFSITSDHFSYMIMDFCAAGDLKQHYLILKSDKGIDEKRVKKLIYDCAQGYKQLEQHKILHMDIKLENILVKSNNYALSDFGLAININSNKKKIGGSMLYLSPRRFIKKN